MHDVLKIIRQRIKEGYEKKYLVLVYSICDYTLSEGYFLIYKEIGQISSILATDLDEKKLALQLDKEGISYSLKTVEQFNSRQRAVERKVVT